MKPIPTPNVTASSPNEAIKQLQSYLYQLAQQLNWDLETLEKEVSQLKNNQQGG